LREITVIHRDQQVLDDVKSLEKYIVQVRQPGDAMLAKIKYR